MDEAAVTQAARAAIAETGAAGMRDMGKVVAALKEKYPGQMDFAQASAIVKGLLAVTSAQRSAASASIAAPALALIRAMPRPPTSSARPSPAWARGWCSAAATAA